MKPAQPLSDADRGAWRWVPSLYFAQGIPYVVVMTVAVVMLKRMGVGNAAIALYTSWLYLPWVIKPLWSPLVQGFGTRRGWTVLMQLLVGAGLAAAALAIPTSDFLRYTLAALAVVAVASATHDVAADGFYMLALSSHQQAWWVGIRSTAYRLAMIAGQGLLVMFAGFLESSTGLPRVEVTVRADDAVPASAAFDPAAEISITGDEQRVGTAAATVAVSLGTRPKSEVDALVEQVRAWNVEHGFYAAPAAAAAASDAESQRTWVHDLEDFIVRRFGEERADAAASDDVGDAAVVLMRLARAVDADEQQVVQIGRSSGDASLQVVEGERFVVTADNWDQPFAAVVQADAKLDAPTEAVFEIRSGNIPLAWSATFFLLAAMFLALCGYHFFALPRPAADAPLAAGERRGVGELLAPFVTFFQKPRIVGVLAYLLLYRFAEAQLTKLAQPFLLDAREAGGLALTTGEVGFVYGTVGVIMLTVGGLIGGFTAARFGLKPLLWPMALVIHLPNLMFVFLAYARPESLAVISTAVGVEQFGYGFGFTAYLLFALYISRGEHQTVHYAMCTGMMALGMMIPGMWSGWLQELIGYRHFFVWIMLATIPSFIAVALVRVEDDFGKETPA